MIARKKGKEDEGRRCDIMKDQKGLDDGTYLLSSRRRSQWKSRTSRLGLGRARTSDTLRSTFFLLVLLLFSSLDRLEPCLDVVHDPADGDFAAGIGVGGDALLNHGEEVVAGCSVAGIVSTLGRGLGGAVERGETQCGRWTGRRRSLARGFYVGRKGVGVML